MTTQVILLGGNGYLGRELTRQWRARDAAAQFTVCSRSGRNELTMAGLNNVAVDVTDAAAVEAALPDQVTYVVDLIGRPEKDPARSRQVNDLPAQVMQQVAAHHHAAAMGFIGGTLGPKAFLQTKARLIQQLQASPVPLAYVEPTLVYGAGRHDAMTKLVPFLRFFGLFAPRLRPIKIEVVVADLLNQLLAHQPEDAHEN